VRDGKKAVKRTKKSDEQKAAQQNSGVNGMERRVVQKERVGERERESEEKG
jgi:hypothetical protein